jgi:predicted dehydrogenase
MPVLRLIQIGLGGWGRDWHRRVLPEAGDVRVQGWVDLDPERRRSFVADFAVPADRVYADLGAALAAHSAEAALVITGIASHAGMVRSAVEAGLHVLVEKPFTASLAEARELVALADQRNQVLVVAQNYRFFPAARTVRTTLNRSAIGRLRHVDIRFRRNVTYPVAGPDADTSPDTSVLLQVSVHHFDLVRYLIGDIVQLSAGRWPLGQVSGSSLSAFDARLELAGGVLVTYSASSASGAPETPWTGEWRIEGELGQLEWTGKDTSERAVARLHLASAAAGLSTGSQNLPLEEVPNDRAAVVAEFVQSIRAGRVSDISGANNLGTIAALEAAQRAMQTGRTERVWTADNSG